MSFLPIPVNIVYHTEHTRQVAVHRVYYVQYVQYVWALEGGRAYMAFFDVNQLRVFAEKFRSERRSRYNRPLRIAYCGNCQCDRECIYLGSDKVPHEFVGTRICLTCGYAPGYNIGVPNKKTRQEVFATDNHECVYCGATTELVLDHIVPHSHGGKPIPDNLLTSCRTCNGYRGTGPTMPLRFGRFRK